MFLEVPQGSLQRAENLVASRKIHVKALVPSLQELGIELGVVGNELG